MCLGIFRPSFGIAGNVLVLGQSVLALLVRCALTLLIRIWSTGLAGQCQKMCLGPCRPMCLGLGKPANKGGNLHLKDTTQTQPQNCEPPPATQTWHVSKYKVHQLGGVSAVCLGIVS